MDVCHAGLLSILQDIEEKGLTREIWLFLTTLCGDKLVKGAVKILSSETIIKHYAKVSHREIWTVSSHKGKANYVMLTPKAFHCSCNAFKDETLHKHTAPFCKHILVVYISTALLKFMSDNKKIYSSEIDDAEFARYLEKVFNECDRDQRN